MSNYPKPHNEIVDDLLGILDTSMLEAYEERAGILEFDAGLSREHAECLALLEVIHRNFVLAKRT